MSKSLSLFFSVVGVLFMCATAMTLSYNGWLAALFLFLSIATIAAGFITKARLRRRGHGSS
ncbi:hypothetical protein ACFO9Q_01975 [Paenibacillus sp. GCM10023252]|uniref:hypothetical protein n=1 Tax=Paenibacillus sp. GCM10023252 TaxID=3252649 RepID=UPI00361F1540